MPKRSLLSKILSFLNSNQYFKAQSANNYLNLTYYSEIVVMTKVRALIHEASKLAEKLRTTQYDEPDAHKTCLLDDLQKHHGLSSFTDNSWQRS